MQASKMWQSRANHTMTCFLFLLRSAITELISSSRAIAFKILYGKQEHFQKLIKLYLSVDSLWWLLIKTSHKGKCLSGFKIGFATDSGFTWLFHQPPKFSFHSWLLLLQLLSPGSKLTWMRLKGKALLIKEFVLIIKSLRYFKLWSSSSKCCASKLLLTGKQAPIPSSRTSAFFEWG